MGIGNSSSAALLMHLLSGNSLLDCVGRGAGLTDAQLQLKLDLLQTAVDQHHETSGPFDVLMTFGGFEIAMMVGAYLKAAELGLVILVDGFIATIALLVAVKMCP